MWQSVALVRGGVMRCCWDGDITESVGGDGGLCFGQHFTSGQYVSRESDSLRIYVARKQLLKPSANCCLAQKPNWQYLMLGPSVKTYPDFIPMRLLIDVAHSDQPETTIFRCELFPVVSARFAHRLTPTWAKLGYRYMWAWCEKAAHHITLASGIRSRPDVYLLLQFSTPPQPDYAPSLTLYKCSRQSMIPLGTVPYGLRDTRLQIKPYRSAKFSGHILTLVIPSPGKIFLHTNTPANQCSPPNPSFQHLMEFRRTSTRNCKRIKKTEYPLQRDQPWLKAFRCELPY